MKKNKIYLILLLIFTAYLVNKLPHSKSEFDPKAVLASIQKQTPNVFEKMRDELPSIIEQGGVEGAMTLAGEAFRQEAITMYECHTFTHLLGHASQLDDEGNTKIIGDFGPSFCEGGFKHGIESQIVLEDPDYKTRLHELCRIYGSKSFGSCYHGAGHTFMRQTLNALEALPICDELKDEVNTEVSDCYYGVFSEYTNLAGGVDGETGLKFPEGPVILLKQPPMEICASLPDPVAIPCALELNGLGISEASSIDDIDKALRRCTSGIYSGGLKAACIQSVAAVGAQHELPRKSTLHLQGYILGLADEFRAAYIKGAATEMLQFIKNGVEKDWQAFCSGFSASPDREFCAEIFQEQNASQKQINMDEIFNSFPTNNASVEEKEKWRQRIAGLAQSSSMLDISRCSPEPAIIKVQKNSNLRIRNSDLVTRNITHGPVENPEIRIQVHALSENSYEVSFKNPGVYGYKCDNSRVGIFYVQ